MAIADIVTYTAMVSRRAEIMLMTGKSWAPALEEELKDLDERIALFLKSHSEGLRELGLIRREDITDDRR